MSPTSYQAAPPRIFILGATRTGVKLCQFPGSPLTLLGYASIEFNLFDGSGASEACGYSVLSSCTSSASLSALPSFHPRGGQPLVLVSDHYVRSLSEPIAPEKPRQEQEAREDTRGGFPVKTQSRLTSGLTFLG